MRIGNLCPPVATAGLLSLLLLARCSLVTSLDGLTGGGDASSASASTSSDGQAPSQTQLVDAEAAEATSSSPDEDSGRSADADANTNTNDASAEDGGAVLFADDFEGTQALPRQWDLIATSDGTLALDTSLFVSPTTSLRATAFPLDAGAAGNAANVTLRKLFPMPASGTTVAYDFAAFPKQYDQTANAVIGALQISDGAGDLYELQLDVQQNAAGTLGVIFAEYSGLADGGSSYVPHPVPGALAVGDWTHIRIALDVAQPPVAQVYFNGALQLETSVDITIQGTAIQISLGLSYVSAPSGAWVVNYDDAVFRFLP